MKVLITTLGRSHFIQVASSLIRAGVDATLFQGWVVKNRRKFWMVRALSPLMKERNVKVVYKRVLEKWVGGRRV